MNYSPSAINCFETCPFKFKCIYIDGLKEPPSPAMLKGRLVHDYLEKKGNLLCGKLDKIVDKDRFESIQSDIYNIEKNLQAIFGDLADAKQIILEKYKKFPLRDVIVSGRVDKILVFDDEMIIADYKTGKFFEYLKDIYKDPQYLIYCWFGGKVYEEMHRERIQKPIYFKIVQIRDDKVRVEKYPCKYTPEELEVIIYDRIKKILKTKSFLPKKNAFCGNCYFNVKCNRSTFVAPKVTTIKKEVSKVDNHDYVEVSFNYSVKSPKQSIISLKASRGRSLRKGETEDAAYDECWNTVADQVQNQLDSLNLEDM